MNNDTNLVIDSFTLIKNKAINAIVNSDHGRCYSSFEFIEMLKEFNLRHQCLELEILLIIKNLNSDLVF